MASNIEKAVVAKNTTCNAMTSLLNNGDIYTTGHLSIYSDSSALITRHALDPTAFNSAVDGTSIANQLEMQLP